MPFWNLNSLELEPFRPGIRSQAKLGDQLIMACMEIAAGEEDIGHQHAYDQCGLVLTGQIEMFIGSTHQRLGPNQSYFIPAGELHGWKTFDEPVTLLDISSRQPAE
ncbi:MAG: cupin domain-containing protein [Sedimenticola sp.]|nr:cupin domain-containing protein [Sedimenticola sp.]